MERSEDNMNFRISLKDEMGSIIPVAVVMLALVLLIGIAATTTAVLNMQMAGNERRHKIAFYEADGGTEAAQEILELNIACPGGFSSDDLLIGRARIVDSDMWLQQGGPSVPYPSDDDAVRDIQIPNSDAVPHTNVTLFGNTEFTTGGALQMAAGYEGLGKAAASGGTILVYDIYSQHHARNQSRSVIMSRWRHVVGQEGSCLY
jgi:hypothetical protein